MSRTSPKDIEYQKKVEAAVKLRLAGLRYEEIISNLGHWNSIQACQKAVQTMLVASRIKNINAERNESVLRLEKLLLKLMDKFDANGSPLISREIVRINDQINKLKGLYAPIKVAETDIKGNDKPKVVVYLPENNR